MSVFQFILASLCCYRATVLFARDAGPFHIFSRLRKVSVLLSCPYCVSMWIAAVIEGGFYFSGVVDAPIVMLCIVFALSAVSIILDRLFTADHLSK